MPWQAKTGLACAGRVAEQLAVSGASGQVAQGFGTHKLMADLGGYLPCRVVVLGTGGVEEIWCALSVRATDGTHIRDELRDILFASLEARFPEAIFEARSDWPTGRVEWWEAVRLGLR